jgi:tetratricopeptide (TPR) repeat protein
VRERVFGVTHGKEMDTKNMLDIIFFTTWDQMYTYGTQHITCVKEYQIDQIEYGFDSFLEKHKLSNEIQRDLQSNNSLEILANEVIILNENPENYKKIIENGWKITELLSSKIKLKVDVTSISGIIVSTHLNHDDIDRALEWIEEMSRCNYEFPEIKHKLIEIKELRNGHHIENITNNKTLNSIAQLYRELRAFAKAEKILLRALELQPNSTYSHTQLGGLYRKTKFYLGGINHYEKALKIKKDKFALNGLGGLFRDFGEYDNALDCYKAALELNSWDMEAHTGIGAVYIDLREYENANYHFEIAGTNTVNFLFKEYRMYEKEKSIDKAIECLEQILNIQPNNSRAKSELNKFNNINKINC